MTQNMQETLTALRKEHEAEETDKDGITWGLVYLDNIGHESRTLAGTLSALKKVGLYKDSGNGEHKFWGYVRIR